MFCFFKWLLVVSTHYKEICSFSDALYDSKTKTVYTPNMNALANLDGSHLTSDAVRCIMELRKKMNWVKGSKGRLAGSVSNGSGGRRI